MKYNSGGVLVATALDVLNEWMTEGAFKAGDRLSDPTDPYLQHRADCVEEVARAIHQIAEATAGQIYPYLGVDELPTFNLGSGASYLFPSMVGVTPNAPRKMVRLKVSSTATGSRRFGRAFEPRGRYGLNAIGLDRQVGRDGQNRAQLCLHLSSRAFVPYADIGDRSMHGQGVSYLWVTITTKGVLRFERVTCEIDPDMLLDASFNRRSKGDALKITRHELTEEERHTEYVLGLTSDLSLLAAYLREIAEAQARL